MLRAVSSLVALSLIAVLASPLYADEAEDKAIQFIRGLGGKCDSSATA